MKPLKIGETATLENGDVVRCVKDESKSNIGCNMCYWYKIRCKEVKCMDYQRADKTYVHFELVKNISPESENIEKKE